MRLTRRRMLSLTGGIGVAGGVTTTAGCLEVTPTRSEIATGERTLTIAHRGGMYLWPENTVLAIENAIEAGADVVEIDVDVTADDELVLVHDETVDRTTDGTGPVAEMTLDELKSLDAGYEFPPPRDDEYVEAVSEHEWLPPEEPHPFRDEGIEVPTLEEVLETVPSDVPLLIECKRERPPPPRMAALLRSYDRVESTLVGAFETAYLERMRETLPAIETGLGASEVRQFLTTTRASERRYDPDGEFLFAPHRMIRPSLVERAHRNGMSVLPWTVNAPDEMQRLVDAGVDGILSNDPVLLGEELPARK